MPIAPSSKQLISTDITTDVNAATRSIPNSGLVASAVSDLGTKVENIGLSLGESLKKSEAIAAVSQTKYDDFAFIDKNKSELLEQSKDGYVKDGNGQVTRNDDGSPRSISQELQSRYDQRFRDNQLNMPSAYAQQLYQQEMGPHFNESVLDTRGKERVLQADAHKQVLLDNIQKTHNTLALTPDFSAMYRNADSLEQDIKMNEAKIQDGKPVGHFSQAQMKLLSDKKDEETTDGYFNGYYDTIKRSKSVDKRAMIETALNQLAAKDDESVRRQQNGLKTVSEMIPENKMDQYVRLFSSLKAESKVQFSADMAHAAEDDMAAADRGRASSPEFMRMLMEHYKSASTPDEARKIEDQNQAHLYARTGRQIVAKQGQDLATSPEWSWPGKTQAILDKMKSIKANSAVGGNRLSNDSNFGVAAENDVISRFASKQNQVRAERDSDAALFVMNHYPDLQAQFKSAGNDPEKNSAAIKALTDQQISIGTPLQYRRVIPKQTSVELAQTLLSNPKTAASGIGMMTQRYGDKTQEVMNQMFADGTLPSKMSGITMTQYTNDPAVVQNIIGNIQTRPEIEKNYALIPEVNRKTFDATVARRADPYLIKDPAYAKYNSEILSEIGTSAKSIKTNNQFNLSDDDIMDHVIENSSLKGISLVDVGATHVRVPPMVGMTAIQPKVIEAYISSHLKSDALTTMDIAHPKELTHAPDYGQMADDKKNDLFLRGIEQRGYFQPAGQDSLQLMYHDKGNAFQVKHRDGSPVVVKFTDMMNQDSFTSKEMAPGAIRRFFQSAQEKGGAALQSTIGQPPPYAKPTDKNPYTGR